MDEAITGQINAALDAIEQQEDVVILYACESGSRAWGFASTDSDYDVRFIYLHKPQWYLSVRSGRDVIEQMTKDGLDIVGWDLRKALQLLQKSNPPLLEKLRSPIVYRRRESFLEQLRSLIPHYYCPRVCMYHYLHIASKTYDCHLQQEHVVLKKYFYALRPILACLWIEQDRGPVPIEFRVLCDVLVQTSPLREDIQSLLETKRKCKEPDQGPRIPSIHNFLQEQFARLSAEGLPASATTDTAKLDSLFLRTLVDVYGPTLIEEKKLSVGNGQQGL